MEKEQRTALRNAVVRARRLLEKEFQEQLEGTYNILPDGSVLDNAPGDPIVRARLVDVIQHHRASGASALDAVECTKREAAFTVLNRFAALKMAERRGLVRECISRGLQSEGMRELAECAPGLRAALEDGGYRLLLEAVMDEISLDLNVLFDRRDAMAQLWPRPKALEELLETLNDPQLDDLWSQDEAIGWIYQYFNDNDVKQMRDAAKGGAPRNSRELAVRNQFFTPRYVVEFLTDNTLGRIWYEMNQGQTRLKEQCRYRVRRPNEAFLQPSERAPELSPRDNLSQEQILQQPIPISHRPLKDPREIRMLDPACGSMHFGLYAFDLFEVIYDEAWEISHGSDEARKASACFAAFVALVAPYPDKAAFVADVPRLIVEHNLHGIDIDPRAVQIAGLSIWLRAQRSWQSQGLRPQDRPRIRRSNIVCAESMPGEETFLNEFIDAYLSITPERKLLGQLVRRVFGAMKLAGEAGSLLMIEEEIAGAVADAKQKWLAAPKVEQGRLFADDSVPPTQQELGLDVTGITDESFWEKAEERIYAALETYAEHAEHGGGYQRRLFADDAARGFAFIDLCRKRYDVVLMNPPYGLAPEATDKWFRKTYVNTCNDLYGGFAQRAFGFTQPFNGFVGAITSKTFLYSKRLREFRTMLSQAPHRLQFLIDLGSGVLDATVETAMWVSGPRITPLTSFWDWTKENKSELGEQAHALLSYAKPRSPVVSPLERFRALPFGVFSYWCPQDVLEAISGLPAFEPKFGESVRGLQTFDDFRFIRLSWEADYADKLKGSWRYIAKGGGWSSYHSETVVLIDWRKGGEIPRQNELKNYGTDARSKQSISFWFRPGLTFSEVSSLGFSAQPQQEGNLFGGSGFCIFPSERESLPFWLAFFNSRPVFSLLAMFSTDRHWTSEMVARLPIPNLTEQARRLAELGTSQFLISRRDGVVSETAVEFAVIKLDHNDSLPEQYADNQREIDEIVANAYGVSSASLDVLEEKYPVPTHRSETAPESGVASVPSYGVGCAFGRWNIRFATGDEHAPDFDAPFEPLPACPPGLLQNEQGFPVTKEDVQRLRAEGRWDYPIEIPWDGVLVDDRGHSLDLEARVRQVLQVIWKERGDAIEREACEFLRIRTLRDYFRKPNGFFADHLKRYSKSRRKAPIYWPLSTPSGSYTIWIYYHRLTADTMFRVVAEHLEPKLRSVQEQRLKVEAGHSRAEGREAAKLAVQVGELVQLEQELEEMKAEFLRLAELPYYPDLNDGVEITAAPLWRLFRLPAWRSVLEETWKNLQKGEYDWAHLSHAIWPERVREKCKTDRSLAIAHGLEDLFEGETKPKKKRGKTSDG